MTRKPSVYLIAGGSWSNFRRILAEIFTHAGLRQPRVAYIGAANKESKDFFQWAAKALKAGGARAVVHLRVSRPGWQKAAARSDAIFVSGGDVGEGMRVLRQASAIVPLKELFLKNMVFIGLSAGSIMLARKWLEWPDEEDHENVQVFSCLGLAPVFCDTHDEPGWTELKALLNQLPAGAQGIGLRSGSAVAVRARGVEILAGTVDTFEKQRSPAAIRRSAVMSAPRGILFGSKKRTQKRKKIV